MFLRRQAMLKRMRVVLDRDFPDGLESRRDAQGYVQIVLSAGFRLQAQSVGWEWRSLVG